MGYEFRYQTVQCAIAKQISRSTTRLPFQLIMDQEASDNAILNSSWEKTPFLDAQLQLHTTLLMRDRSKRKICARPRLG